MFPEPIPRMASFDYHRRRRCHHRIYATVITSFSLKYPNKYRCLVDDDVDDNGANENGDDNDDVDEDDDVEYSRTFCKKDKR